MDDCIITEQSAEGVLEVVLTDVDGTEHVYWVMFSDCPEAEDETDWAIAQARRFHGQQGLPSVPEDEFTDDGELETYAFASEPFSREPGEYTLVPTP